MTMYRPIAAFVVIAFATAATLAAVTRPHTSGTIRPEFVGTATRGTAPIVQPKKAVRYGATIANWERYRAGIGNTTGDKVSMAPR